MGARVSVAPRGKSWDSRDKALAAAKQAAELNPTANVFDTLACAYAASGDYAQAQVAAQRAADGATGAQRQRFLARLEKFIGEKNCVGEV